MFIYYTYNNYLIWQRYKEKHIGILGAITPAITFIVSPIWGIVADTTGRHKRIMLLTFIGSVMLRCLLAIQKGNIILLAILVASSALLNAPVKPLMDSAVMSMLKDKSDYGKSRLFGQLVSTSDDYDLFIFINFVYLSIL